MANILPYQLIRGRLISYYSQYKKLHILLIYRNNMIYCHIVTNTGLDQRTGVKELPLKDIQAKIYNKIDEVKIGENNQDIVRFNPKVRARFQVNPHRNVFMTFSISVFGPELLLLQPKLQVSKHKPRVSILKHHLSTTGAHAKQA